MFPNFGGRLADRLAAERDQLVGAVELELAIFSEITRIRPAWARRPDVAIPIDLAKSAIT